ncbi:MAG: aminopeptidase P family protein [Nitrospinaceae bacterium]|jgi:Xaa-Pro aminopeptidase|nr:aminopeptidase P family protein [Nitrospinaceae bacterium]MBT3434658.1 aminopeptidase P family protein [Nitrospinaceae bacterium]MBT3819898.1 aminopeptidase P family protein [Nitrospinaceae bacterium]MBT4095752.1 aminopeptidase P family protein [Nitrospinaceae bacterium]MBT4432596.1 aminopeptidase P family protein [Nitrospinaceae bacterium]
MSERLKALRRKMRREGVSALAVTDLRNLRYLTGFTGTAGGCFVTERSAVFITDFRYRSQVSRQVDKAFKFSEHNHPIIGIAAEAKKSRVKTLGFEESALTYNLYSRLKKEVRGVRLVPVQGLVEGLRLLKDKKEVRLLRRGAKLNKEALSEAALMMGPGVTELEVSLALEVAMRERGASGPAFDFIVASGTRGALPHGVASSRSLRRGDLITIDYGAVVEGYHADTTRVFSLGEPSKKAQRIYDIVLKAQMAAVDTVGPNVKCGDVDEAARRVIREEGFGKFFGHGTGHGVGLDIHEGPRLGPGVEERLKPGMMVTIEPGIYLPGWSGVRIEDMVLVTERGKEVLTRAITKDLVVL